MSAAQVVIWSLTGVYIVILIGCWDYRRSSRKMDAWWATLSERPDPKADRHVAFPESRIKWAEPPVGRRPVSGPCPSCGAGEKRYCAMDCQLLDPCNPW